MSIATVITRGYGSFGSIKYVVTEGYDIGTPPPASPVIIRLYGFVNTILNLNGFVNTILNLIGYVGDDGS